MAKPDQTRRKFIGTLVSLLAAFLLLGKFLTPRLKRKKTLLSVAKGDIPPHGALVFRESRVAVIREGGTVYALSLVCTHLGCSVNVTPSEILCPCHGSRFDRQGNVLQGPANRPLTRYAVEEQGERIIVLT